MIMNERLELTAVLYSFVGKTFKRDGRDVRVLCMLSGPVDSYYICVWDDTCVAYTASLFEVGNAMDAKHFEIE